MKKKQKRVLLTVLIIPLVIIVGWFLVCEGYLVLCELGICDFLPVKKITLYEKDGITVSKNLPGATGSDALVIYKNDSVIHAEDIIGDLVDGVVSVTTTDSIRVVILERIPLTNRSPIDSVETRQRTITLPRDL